MAAPTNISGVTAIALTVSATVTQDVNDAGTTYTVWYTYTAQVGDNVIGVFAHSDDVAVYQPHLEIFTPDAVTPMTMGAAVNLPVQFPVTPAQVYYLRLTSLTGNVATAHLTIEVYAHGEVLTPTGGILIPDDLPGYPMAVLNPTTGTVDRFVQGIPAGESAVQHNDCSWAMEAWTIYPTQSTTVIRAYSRSFSQIFELVVDPTTFQDAHLSTTRTSGWYVMLSIDTHIGGGAPTIQRVSDAGAVTATWILTPHIGTGSYYRPRSFATARDETVAYLGVTSDYSIKRWDLVADAALSDLVAQYDSRVPLEMLVLADETLIVCWWTTIAFGDHGDLVIHRYSRSGTLMNDYGSFGVVQDPRIAYAADDPASFWVDVKPYPHPLGAITVQRIRTSDGTVLTSVPTTTFERGAYNGTPTLTPPARFGRSESCPFIVIPPEGECGGNGGNGNGNGGTGDTEPPHVAPSYHLDERYIRRLRRAPHVNHDNLRVFVRKFELDLERGQGLATGQGSDPMVLLRLSRDGGQTWGEEIRMAAGALGAYTQRVLARRLGHGRDTVFEVVVSDPIAWSLVGAWLDVEPGAH